MSRKQAGDYFKAWREDKGLTQADVQAGAKVSISTQGRFEKTGDISDKKIRGLAAFMGEDAPPMLKLAGHKTPYNRSLSGETDPRARILLEAYKKLPDNRKDEAFQDILAILQRRR